MKKIILTILLLPVVTFADVTIHENKFDLSQSVEGDHFWARFYDWSAWEKTSEQKTLILKPNFVKAAYDLALPRVDAEPLTPRDFIAVLGDTEGEALAEFYEDREEVDEDDLGRYSGMVTQIKVSLPVTRSMDVSNITTSDAAQIISNADKPHMHKKILKDFARRFLDPVHSGHKAIDDLGAGELYLTVINTGSEAYSCGAMNSLLVVKSEIEGISSYDGDFRMYAINAIKELSADEISKLGSVLDANPVRVFEQKVIYSSTLIKGAVNHLAFYNTPSGLRMTLNAVLVATGRVKSVAGAFLNGINISNSLFTGIDFKDGVAVLNSGSVDLSPPGMVAEYIDSCQRGLGQGVGKYVYRLAKRISE